MSAALKLYWYGPLTGPASATEVSADAEGAMAMAPRAVAARTCRRVDFIRGTPG